MTFGTVLASISVVDEHAYTTRNWVISNNKFHDTKRWADFCFHDSSVKDLTSRPANQDQNLNNNFDMRKSRLSNVVGEVQSHLKFSNIMWL